MPAKSSKDWQLDHRLTRLRGDHSDQWAYGNRSEKAQKNALFQYPAMMVGDMQRDLLKALLEDVPQADGPVFDPFVGSGTVLSAGMVLGRDVVGWDINPLAILICRVKSGPFHLGALSEAVARAVPDGPCRTAPEERFENWRHWFTDDVARGLTDLRRRVRREPRVATRRFLWLCLAETVRLTSNSRTSTVKLHRRAEEQIANRPDPIAVFTRVAADNLARLRAAQRELSDAGRLTRGGWYAGELALSLGDTRELTWEGQQSAALVTSPPYGDNTSTVPYGQHAYLPLQWIDLEDIDPSASRDCLATTYEIDRRSLGGSKKIQSSDEEDLRQRSRTLNRLVTALADEKRDRRNRVLAFTRDLDAALRVVATGVAPGAAAAWTVGSRRVGGQVVPLEQLLVELAAHRGFSHVKTLSRDIPGHRKRMAARNSAGATMLREHVVVLRRDGK
jgi:DNA methylase